MVTSEQRRRQLARSKWDRQSVRRQQQARRRRRISLVISVIVVLVAVAAIAWLVAYLAGQEEDDGVPTTPTESFSTELPTQNTSGSPEQPTGPDQPTGSEPTGSAEPTEAS